VPLSYALQPSWLFQAAEKNSVLAILTVSSRLLSALLVVTLIKGPVDVLLIPAIIGSCNVASATASLFYARQSLGLEFQKIPLLELINFLREGKKIFMGNLSVLLYRDFNVVILGLVQGSATAVAAYSIAEKVTKGLQATMRPFNQIYFPKTLKRLGTNKKVERESLKDIWPCIYPQFIALSLVLSAAILAFFVAAIYFNIEKNVPELTNIAILSTLMIPATFFGIANFMLGTVGLNYLKEQDYMYKSILITGAANTVLCFLLSSQLSAIGTALTFTVSEGFLLALITSKFLTNRHPAKLKNN
jgi:O-antigen/teichoic acid export membrane protein